LVYALPNIYAPDPAIQNSSESRDRSLSDAELASDTLALTDNGIADSGEQLQPRAALIRLQNQDDQLRAQSLVKRALGDGFVVALNMAATAPDWLRGIGAGPMKLGLDLSGGVHFLMEVDTAAAVE